MGGVACFFIGAWTIGVFGFWGPCFFGDDVRYDKGVPFFKSKYGPGGSNMEPSFGWVWTHVLQFIGACFLTLGGIIFGAMDGIFGGGSGGKQAESDEESDSE